jgi:class 3 adenylate cyclase
MPTASGAAGRGRRVAPLRVATAAQEVDVLVREQVEQSGAELAAVMCTDVARTTHLSIEEDTWRALIHEYGVIVSRQAVRYNGTVVGSRDGLFVRFSGAYSAVRCALAIRQDLLDLGLDLRAGLHAGEGNVRNPDLTTAVAHVANRICCVASAGRVLTSRMLADLVAGSGIAFEDAGTHRLDDLPGEWQLLAISE